MNDKCPVFHSLVRIFQIARFQILSFSLLHRQKGWRSTCSTPTTIELDFARAKLRALQIFISMADVDGHRCRVKSIAREPWDRVIRREKRKKDEDEERKRREKRKRKIDKGRIGGACRGKTLGKRNFTMLRRDTTGISQYYENYILVKWNSLLLLRAARANWKARASARDRVTGCSARRDQGAPAWNPFNYSII